MRGMKSTSTPKPEFFRTPIIPILPIPPILKPWFCGGNWVSGERYCPPHRV